MPRRNKLIDRTGDEAGDKADQIEMGLSVCAVCWNLSDAKEL